MNVDMGEQNSVPDKLSICGIGFSILLHLGTLSVAERSHGSVFWKSKNVFLDPIYDLMLY